MVEVLGDLFQPKSYAIRSIMGAYGPTHTELYALMSSTSGWAGCWDDHI